MKMVRNDWENSLNGPNPSKNLPNCPKMSQNVPSCPKMPTSEHHCPNGLVLNGFNLETTAQTASVPSNKTKKPPLFFVLGKIENVLKSK